MYFPARRTRGGLAGRRFWIADPHFFLDVRIAMCLVCTKQDVLMPGKPESFGATIRRLREGKFTLRKFAEKVSISPTYLSKIERDEFPAPGEDAVRRMAEFLNEDPDELLALAGKVSSDLPGIIQKHPREMATFLRAAKGLTAQDIEKFIKRAQEMQKKSRPK
jgi:HTH-type transcriptional regulator, competence development regulator